MNTEQQALWQLLIVLARDSRTKYISIGSTARREVLVAVDEEMGRLRREVAELRGKLARLERRLGTVSNEGVGH